MTTAGPVRTVTPRGEAPAGPSPALPPGPAPVRPRRRPLKLRTLRRTLAGAVVAAMVALATVGTVRDLDRADAVRDYADSLDRLAKPVPALVSRLQAERRAAAAHWAHRSDGGTDLRTRQARTDRAARAVRELGGGGKEAAAEGPMSEVLYGLDSLVTVRSRVGSRSGDRDDALDAYSLLIDRTLDLQRELRPDDGDLAYATGPLAALQQAGEELAREDTVLAGSAAPGRLSAAERARFAAAVGAQRAAFGTQDTSDIPSVQREAYTELTRSPAWRAKTRAEDAVTRAATRADGSVLLPTAAAGWQRAYADLRPDLDRLSAARVQSLVRQARDEAADRQETALWTAAGTALLILALLTLIILLTRRVIRRIEELRSSALDVARRQLPPIILRLQRGEEADLSALPPQTVAGDEFGEIANVVARLAEEVVDAAGVVHEERHGFEKFAEGVTLRAVTLIVAILRTLDELQDRYADTDPELLAELYELDHLTVRVRRQLENLLVLSGGAVATPHTDPVHVANLIVDAAGEARGFARVAKEFHAEAWVLPEVAGELTHLIAELIENATTYSPSGYEVTVRATDAAGGVAIEVEDRGRAPDHWYFESLNGRLLDVPPYAVLANSADQLGLFVVGQLAQRHGVRVSLDRGDAGGVRAVVVVPDALLTRKPGEVARYTSLPPRRAAQEGARERRSGPRAAERPHAMTGAGLARRQPARREVTAVTAEQPARTAAPTAERPARAPAPAAALETAQPREPARAPGPAPAREPAPTSPAGLPQRVPGSNMAAQLRARAGRTEPRAVLDDRSLDHIESAFTGLQQALTDTGSDGASPDTPTERDRHP